MNIRWHIKKILNKCGIDIRELSPTRSDAARLKAILTNCGIEQVLDVGANAGQYAGYLRAIGYKGRILCFEPLSSAYVQLQKFSALDRLIEVAPQMALGDYDGEIALNISSNSESSSILPMLAAHLNAEPLSEYTGTETVPIRRLDSVLDEFHKHPEGLFLKIDAQGYEKQVLQGAARILPKIKGIQLEMSLVQFYEGEPLYREMIDMMESLGYDLYDLNPNFADRNTGRVYQVDGIFIRC